VQISTKAVQKPAIKQNRKNRQQKPRLSTMTSHVTRTQQNG